MTLHFKTLGEPNKPPLIILHGLFGMLDNWQTLGRAFAAMGLYVYLIDQRNHGKSPHTEEMDYYSMADDLQAWMEEQELEKAYLLGHSMGGKTAMQFAVDHPEMVQKLIIVDIAPKDYPAGHQDIFDGFFAVNIDTIQTRKEADKMLATKVKEVGIRQFLLKNLSRQKEGGYRWKCNLEVLYRHYEEVIINSLSIGEVYDGPTLFIKGALSERYIEVEEDLPLLEHHFPNYQLEIVEESGHWVHAEQPEALKKIVKNFLIDQYIVN